MSKTKEIKVYATGEIKKIEDFKLKVGERRGSQYDGVYAMLAKLKPGQAFEVDVPKDVDVRTFHNRTNAAIRRGPVTAPEGCMFRKRTSEKGKVVITCAKLDEAEAPAKSKGKSKAKKKSTKASDEKPPHPDAI